MTKWARKNDNGQIVEIIDFDPTDKFHPSIAWEEVSDSATVFVSNANLESPAPSGPALTSEEAEAARIAKIEATAKANQWRASENLPLIPVDSQGLPISNN